MREIQTAIVLDCSGPLGLQILHKAIHHDLNVTAYALDPKTIPDNVTKRLHRIIQGDVLDEHKVEEAIAGYDAVLCAIESYDIFSRKTAISQGCQNIIRAMKKHGIRKLAIASDAIALQGSGDIQERTRKKYGINAEYIQMMDILENEKASIDWVALMLPKVIISQKVNPMYKVERNDMPGEWSVTSGEIADFMVKVFLDRSSTECFRHNSLGISSRPRSTKHSAYCNIMTFVLVFVFALLLCHNHLPPILQQYLDEIANMGPTDY